MVLDVLIHIKNSLFFFFNDTATTEIYTLSLHDALPIFHKGHKGAALHVWGFFFESFVEDRKSTRLNSSHITNTYAVFCLKKKKTQKHPDRVQQHTLQPQQRPVHGPDHYS